MSTKGVQIIVSFLGENFNGQRVILTLPLNKTVTVAELKKFVLECATCKDTPRNHEAMENFIATAKTTLEKLKTADVVIRQAGRMSPYDKSQQNNPVTKETLIYFILQ